MNEPNWCGASDGECGDPAKCGSGPPPTRRVSLGLTRGGEMHVSLPGKPNEPLDDRTLEALRTVGEAALDRAFL